MLTRLNNAEPAGLSEIDVEEAALVGGAGWGGAVFGAYMGAEFGPVGVVVGAVAGHMLLD